MKKITGRIPCSVNGYLCFNSPLKRANCSFKVIFQIAAIKSDELFLNPPKINFLTLIHISHCVGYDFLHFEFSYLLTGNRRIVFFFYASFSSLLAVFPWICVYMFWEFPIPQVFFHYYDGRSFSFPFLIVSFVHKLHFICQVGGEILNVFQFSFLYFYIESIYWVLNFYTNFCKWRIQSIDYVSRNIQINCKTLLIST